MKFSFTVPIAIVIGGIIIAFAVYVSAPKQPVQIERADNSFLVRPIGVGDHILGNPAAPVVIVEYADFDCEYCKVFNETLRQVVANEGAKGQVAWVFREFPLLEIHPNALAHARAAECAAQVAGEDMFWKFEVALFANQPVNPSHYGTIAKSVGISDDMFATCYANAVSTVETRILTDRKNALDIGAQGTPYSIILVAGKPYVVIDNAYPYDTVKQLVSQALAYYSSTSPSR